MSFNRPKIAVIMGGQSAEREVSLMSGDTVIRALDPDRYTVRTYDLPGDMVRLVDDAPCLDAALIIMHGRGGEDGCVQGLLDLLGLPYQSSGVLGCALAMNKVVSKQMFINAGLPVAPGFAMHRGEKPPLSRALEEIGLPLVVKPAHEGSSFGVTICTKAEDVIPAIDFALASDSLIMIEKCVIGREITCGVMGWPEPEALPLVEISPGEGHVFFDYIAKYTPGATAETCPARISDKDTRLIQELGVAAHHALGLERYSRADFILGQDGPVLLEVNTIPGMTGTSLLPQAAAAAGMDYPALVERLIELALKSMRRP